MKFTLTINQLKAIELDIPSVKHAHILDLLMSCSIWAEPVSINGRIYYWVARQKVCSELPILKLKPDTVYRYLKQLAELKLISYKKLGKKDCISVTDLGKSYYIGKFSETEKNTMSDKNPSNDKTRKNIRINSENFPTDTTYNINKIAAAKASKQSMTKEWQPAINSALIQELIKSGITQDVIELEIKNYRIAKLADPSDQRTPKHWTNSFVQTLLRRPKLVEINYQKSVSKMSDAELVNECHKNGLHSHGHSRFELEKKLTEHKRDIRE